MRKQLTTYRPVISTLTMGMVLSFLCSTFDKLFSFNIIFIQAGITGITLIICVILLYRSHRRIDSFVNELGTEIARLQPKNMVDFSIPVVTTLDDEIVWYNKSADVQIASGTDLIGKNIKEIIGDKKSHRDRFNVSYGNQEYIVFPIENERGGEEVSYYFIEDTNAITYSRRYFATRHSIFFISIDGYAELMKSDFEREISQAFLQLEKKIEEYISSYNGILFKIDRDRFVALVEERYMPQIIEGHFSILDDARELSINNDNLAISLSIGVVRLVENYNDGKKIAFQALEMAQGRGGDQVALKTDSGYDFYGGVSKGVEKQNKVKTRIMANSISDQIEQSDIVFLMGHHMPDFDCFGACVGLSHEAKRLGRRTCIVLGDSRNISNLLISDVNSLDPELIIDYKKALLMLPAYRRPLLIICDTHIKSSIESQELFNAVPNIIVVDHHRKTVGFIDNSLIFCHEPYASSACEMVTELIQYFEDKPDLNVVEAQALLAGIMLDTKNFVTKTGARTFEAASFLRKHGADTVSTRKYFATSFDRFKQRSILISMAEYYNNCAIVMSDMDDPDIRVIASQTADELLNVENITASFVIYKTESQVCISARSGGELNVQLVMEQLGGGGHMTMAATQMNDITLENTKKKLIKAIDTVIADKG